MATEETEFHYHHRRRCRRHHHHHRPVFVATSHDIVLKKCPIAGGWWRGNLGGWWRGNLIHSRTEDFISAGPLGAGSGRRRRRAAPKPFFGCGLGGASSCCGTSGDRRAAAEPPPTAAHKAALAARARARGHRTFSGWRGRLFRRFCL